MGVPLYITSYLFSCCYKICCSSLTFLILIIMYLSVGLFAVVQLLNHAQLFATPWTAAHQASPYFTISWSLCKLMSIESTMPSNHLILSQLLSSCLQGSWAPFIWNSLNILICRVHHVKCWAGWTQAASRLPGEISIASDMQMTPPLWQKVKKN